MHLARAWKAAFVLVFEVLVPGTDVPLNSSSVRDDLGLDACLPELAFAADWWRVVQDGEAASEAEGAKLARRHDEVNGLNMLLFGQVSLEEMNRSTLQQAERNELAALRSKHCRCRLKIDVLLGYGNQH